MVKVRPRRFYFVRFVSRTDFISLFHSIRPRRDAVVAHAVRRLSLKVIWAQSGSRTLPSRSVSRRGRLFAARELTPILLPSDERTSSSPLAPFLRADPKLPPPSLAFRSFLGSDYFASTCRILSRLPYRRPCHRPSTSRTSPLHCRETDPHRGGQELRGRRVRPRSRACPTSQHPSRSLPFVADVFFMFSLPIRVGRPFPLRYRRPP